MPLLVRKLWPKIKRKKGENVGPSQIHFTEENHIKNIRKKSQLPLPTSANTDAQADPFKSSQRILAKTYSYVGLQYTPHRGALQKSRE